MFIGRHDELKKLEQLLIGKRAKLSVVKGRRRIGKSRLLDEFGKRSKNFDYVYFTSLPPEEKVMAADERNFFAKQLSKNFSIPMPGVNDWADLLWTLADRLKQKKKSIVVFDEINWIAQKDPTFLGKLKAVWDSDLSKIPNLVLFLSGSLTGWIQQNILNNTGFLGRIDLDLTLEELPVKDCMNFWGNRSNRISTYEKLRILSVTGGVPRYLEEIDPRQNADENIRRLFFDKSGLLFREFNNLFSDLFQNRNKIYKQIVEAIAEKPLDLDGLYKKLEVSRSGWVSELAEDLITCGFIKRDYTWRLKDGALSKLSRLRLSDNYLRFYLKAVAPHIQKIERNSFTGLPSLDTHLGLQFENIILANRPVIWKILGISPQNIINDNPFFQRSTERQAGCQIDYLIQMRRNILYICEVKFNAKPLAKSIISEVQNKVEKIHMPKNMTYRPILICVNGVVDSVLEKDYFDHIIDMEDLVGN